MAEGVMHISSAEYEVPNRPTNRYVLELGRCCSRDGEHLGSLGGLHGIVCNPCFMLLIPNQGQLIL
jgi:hypothetical protein